MARKYGKNETTLSNVLKLVKALLALADGEIAVPGDKLKATFKVEWVKEDELLVSGKVQEKRNNRTQTVEKGITKEDLWTLVESSREVLELSQVKDEKNKPTEAERKSNAIQDILDCLKDLDILVEKLIDGKPTIKTQGFWKFSLKLKHQAKTEENLKFITEQWKIKNGSVTVETSHQTVISKDKPLNWQEICRQNLAQQKELTTNPFTNAYGVTPQLDKVYVRLAIVERKPPKPPSINQPEEKEEEKLIPITEDSFFEDVLRQGKSKISQGRKIAIIGEPGSGKTTRLQKIAYEILDKGLGLPIWISLADFTQPTITQYIEEIWLKQTGKSLTIEEFTQQKERIWLLLDGLDEMTSRVETRHVSALLGGWVQAARVVVTCRVNVWEADKNAFSGFDVFRNLEFNPEQVTDYIRRWFAAMGDAATGESLEAELEQSENYRLKELIQNPLRLWMLCQIWRLRRGILPDTKAGLYELFVKYIYHWNKYEETIKIYAKLCGINQRQCKENLHKALGELAKAAFAQKSAFFRLSYQLVDKYLGDENEETSLFSLARSLGWLNRVGLDINEPEKSTYMFYHATFQEYFAALAVDDWDYFLPRNHVNFPVPGKEYRIFEPQWKQVILLWLGREHIVDKEEFINQLVNFEDGCGEWDYEFILDRGFYEYRAYFLAAAGIAEFKDSSLADDIVNKIIELCFKYLNMRSAKILMIVIGEANIALFETCKPIVIERLIEFLLIHSDSRNSRQYVEILGKLAVGDQAFIDKLINHIDKSSDEDLRRIIFNILGKIAISNKPAIDFLIKLIKLSQDEPTRKQAIAVLGEIGVNNQAASYFLREYITVTQDEDTILQIAESLGKIDFDKQKAIEIIVTVIKTTQSKYNREEAVNSLGKIGLNNQTAINTLVELINTVQNEEPYREHEFQFINNILFPAVTNESTCRTIAITLGEIASGNQTAIDALIDLFKTTKDKDIRDKAADSLVNIATGNQRAIKELNDYIKHNQDENIRKQVANILSQIDPKTPNSVMDQSVFASLMDQSTFASLQSLFREVTLSHSDRESLIANLLNSIRTTKNRSDIKKAIDSLKNILLISKTATNVSKILQIDPALSLYLLPRVVTGLKDCLCDETCKNDFEKFDNCYQVIWQCAQNLSYPDFYHAWHGLTEI